jgi:hypothetical protein
MALISSFGKQGVQLGLLSRHVDIEDTEYLSKYFVLSEFNPIFTGGRNPVSFNGSNLLQDKSELQIECLDSQGNSLYLERAKSVDSQFSDAANFVVSIHVYEETYNGTGKLIIVGKTKKGEVVRWIGNITIDKTLPNTSKVRFYYKPTLEARPLLYPVVDTSLAQTNYPPPPAVRVATAVAVIRSYVVGTQIHGSGTGYTGATAISFYGGGGTGAFGYTVIAAGTITGIVITNAGNGYTSAPSIAISDTGGGVGASAVSIIRSEVINVIITDGGTGYLFTPAIIFTGLGTGAAATATVVDGVITAISMDFGGDGYITAPTVTFDVPAPPAAPDLNVPVAFSSTFYTYAADPVKDSNKNAVNPKRTDFDYRLVLTGINPLDLQSTTFPSSSFNTQMEGRTITLHVSRVQLPFSVTEQVTDITASYTIKKVLNNTTAQLSEPYYHPSGKNQLVANIVSGRCFVDYRFILYNTNADSNKKLTLSSTEIVDIKESYAEVIYRNLRTYSGFVARHKLYRKSSFSPGDFQLVSDELLNSTELLLDPVTFNKFYEKMGQFYHQPHIAKYWWAGDTSLTLEAKTTPINSMRIYAADPATVDGTVGVMAKNDSIGITNDSIYYPYDADQNANLSGPAYNSNFVSLKKDATYMLSVDVIMEKPIDSTSKVEFFFTSSIASMQTEKNYQGLFGLKLGEISTSDKVETKYFNKSQRIFFTPSDDYFGTLVVVPNKCNVTLSNLSLKVYGDHGFSPDVLVIQIPFSVKVKNEAFDLKAELLDIDSNVVYSNLRTVQSFDSDGESLYTAAQANPVNSIVRITQRSSNTPGVSWNGVPSFPDLTNCDATSRLVGWHIPDGGETDGQLCYLNVSELRIDSDNYIVVSEFQSGIQHTAKSVAVRYDFDASEGRKIVIDAAGNKETFP